MNVDPDVIEISGLSIMVIAILNNDEFSPKQKINEINLAIAKAACKIENLKALERERKKIWDNLPVKLKFFALLMAARKHINIVKIFRRKND